ncbi:MAG: endoribonuclease L-PSP [Verrucomicrobia subdivision 3 bacterium]|nr:endoribonuclease L-PSP [Verrucomicrobiota bacterium]MCC6822239.1 endoribonuclease L-PSP [Limisphaerales bacterium]
MMTEHLPGVETSAPGLWRRHRPGLQECGIRRGGVLELHYTLLPLPGESAIGMLERLAALLKTHNASVVRHEVFGAVAAQPEFATALRRLFGDQPWPVAFVEGASCNAESLAGMHVLAVVGARVESLAVNDRVVGRVFDDGHARHCVLGDVRPAEVTASREQQALQAFENLEAALSRAGMSLPNVARTWLFMDDILAWYAPLNQVRREFFERRHLFDHTVPASTGVGGRNPVGAALVAGAWAVEPTNGSFFMGEVGSPMQCPAPAYGSCFSRAVEIVTPGWRRMFISGTASIAPKGDSVCAGDVDGQIDLTMQVVRAILVSRELDYSDVTRATAYLRNPADAPLFRRWCVRLGLENWPLIITQAVVCRDELLFEIEVDAMAPVRKRTTSTWEI